MGKFRNKLPEPPGRNMSGMNARTRRRSSEHGIEDLPGGAYSRPAAGSPAAEPTLRVFNHDYAVVDKDS